MKQGFAYIVKFKLIGSCHPLRIPARSTLPGKYKAPSCMLCDLHKKNEVSKNNPGGLRCNLRVRAAPICAKLVDCTYWWNSAYLKMERISNSKVSVLLIPQVLEVRESLWKGEPLFHPQCQNYYINHHGPLPGCGKHGHDFQSNQGPKVPPEFSSSEKQTHNNWPDKNNTPLLRKISFYFLLTLASPSRKPGSNFS